MIAMMDMELWRVLQCLVGSVRLEAVVEAVASVAVDCVCMQGQSGSPTLPSFDHTLSCVCMAVPVTGTVALVIDMGLWQWARHWKGKVSGMLSRKVGCA